MFSRKILTIIDKFIKKDQIILITGARQVGKTTIMLLIKKKLEAQNKTCFFLNLEKIDYRLRLDKDPNNIWEIIPRKDKKIYLFLDEVQYLKDPSNFLKFHFDENKKNLKIITSGSSAFYLDQKFRDSLAGRKFIFEIYPLDFEEFLKFKQKDEILQLIRDNQKTSQIYKSELLQLWKEYVQYGAYPEIALEKDEEIKKIMLENLVLSYIKKDILESKVKSTEKYFQILRILAAQTGELLNANSLSNIINLSVPSVEEYLRIMQKSYHIALIRPFYTNVKKELSKMPKVYFFDFGIRNYLLNNFSFIKEREDKGQYLENIVFLNFLHAGNSLENINFWRTPSKNEVDFIISREKAYEVKFNKAKFTESKYSKFKKNYPKIGLDIITYKDVEGGNFPPTFESKK